MSIGNNDSDQQSAVDVLMDAFNVDGELGEPHQNVNQQGFGYVPEETFETGERGVPEEEEQFVDPEQLMAFMQSIVDGQSTMAERLNAIQNPEGELSEDEQAMVELTKMLGVDKMQEQLQSLLEQNNQLQQIAEQQRVQNSIASIKAEFPDFDEDAVYQKIMEYNRTNPQFAAALDTPEGWRLVWGQISGKSKPQGMPDAVPAGAGRGDIVPSRDRMKAMKEGAMSSVDRGNFLLDLAGQK